MTSTDCKQVPRGKPKSGRLWKTVKEKSFADLNRPKQLKTSWSQKMAVKREKQLVKAFERELKDAKAKEEEKRKRRAENIKRREENARKSEVVQEIKNPAKLKRMKKKQLRMIKKR